MTRRQALLILILFVPSTSVCSQGFFRTPAAFPPIGSLPVTSTGMTVKTWPFTADISNDGIADLIVPGLPVACALGLGGGAYGPFNAPVPPPSQWQPNVGWIREMVTDLNNDGNPDLLGGTASGVHAFIGDGAGGFTPSLPAPGLSTQFFSASDFGDLDGDGIPELVGTYGPLGSGVLSIWKFQGGGWVVWQQLPIGLPGALVIGDFDGNGWNDIAGSWLNPPGSATGGSLYVFFNEGAAQTFTLSGPIGAYAIYMTVADLDGDGCDDIVNSGGPGVQLGSPQRVFSPYRYLTFNQSSIYVVHMPGISWGFNVIPRIKDVNMDGILDWIWVAQVAEAPSLSAPVALQVRVFLGLGNGDFVGPGYDDDELILPTSDGVNGGISDIDGDGDPDVIINSNDRPFPSQSRWGVALNETFTGPGTAGGLGVAPFLSIPTAPFPGNAGFQVDLSQAWPNELALLSLSILPSAGTGPTNWWIDLSTLVLPTPTIGVMTTDAAGNASFPVPIPPDTVPGIKGLEAYVQWAVRDPAGPYNLVGNHYFSFSNARKLVVW